MVIFTAEINNFQRIATPKGVSDSFIEWLVNEGFFTAPASIKYHGAQEGGLYDHSRAVTETLIWMTEQLGLQWQNPRSPWIIGMFHDLCKIDQYTKISGGSMTHFEHNKDVSLTGHGDKSVMLLSRWMTLTEEEILCIRYHMGAYETNEWGLYDKAIKQFPNVLWTHTADMYASKVVGK